MSMPTSLRAAVEDIRRDVRERVRAEGVDASQVAIDNMTWCHAEAEAALATREWAETTGSAVAALIADAAEAEAWGLLRGRNAAAVVQDGLRQAELARRLESVDELGLAPEYRLLRRTLRDFSERVVHPAAQDIHRGDLDVPEDIIRGIARLGLFGLSIPEARGGSQEETADHVRMVVATEELSRASLAAGSLITRGEILVRAVLRAGTADQRQRWLSAIASGEMLVAVAVTEPDAGSDVAALKCRALRTADGGWEISGSKLWCTFAGRAELLMVLCRTGQPGGKGLSVFVLEKPAFAGRAFEHRQPTGGSLRGRAIPTLGYRGLHSFELLFDRYSAPAEALLGGDAWLDRGLQLQLEGFAIGRVQTAGRAVGLMDAALERALAYSRQRSVFGRTEFEHQLVQAKLGAMAVKLNAARQLTYGAARLLDRGGGQIESALAKLYSARAAEAVTREAMQLHGAMGYAEETEVSRYFVDARVLAIFEGAEEVLSIRVVGRALIDGSL